MYSLKYKHGTRITDFVTTTDFGVCWLWLGGFFNDDYPAYKGKRASRESYKAAYGTIPFPKIIHHICRNILCVNPRHLVAVDPQNHPDDGAARNRNKRFCKRGHEFTVENTLCMRVISHGRWWTNERRCRKCIKIIKERTKQNKTKENTKNECITTSTLRRA